MAKKNKPAGGITNPGNLPMPGVGGGQQPAPTGAGQAGGQQTPPARGTRRPRQTPGATTTTTTTVIPPVIQPGQGGTPPTRPRPRTTPTPQNFFQRNWGWLLGLLLLLVALALVGWKAFHCDKTKGNADSASFPGITAGNMEVSDPAPMKDVSMPKEKLSQQKAVISAITNTLPIGSAAITQTGQNNLVNIGGTITGAINYYGDRRPAVTTLTPQPQWPNDTEADMVGDILNPCCGNDPKTDRVTTHSTIPSGADHIYRYPTGWNVIGENIMVEGVESAYNLGTDENPRWVLVKDYTNGSTASIRIRNLRSTPLQVEFELTRKSGSIP